MSRAGRGCRSFPLPEQQEGWPTDLLAPSGGDAEAAPGEGEPAVAAMPFDGIELEPSRKRLAGWSAERQKLFLIALAETGSVHLAADAARLSARSAYLLRVRSLAFAKAWAVAEQLAVGRLASMAFDRAINGRVEQVYREGQLVAERRVPNDKMLMWLLARLDPKLFALPGSNAATPTRTRRRWRRSRGCWTRWLTWRGELEPSSAGERLPRAIGRQRVEMARVGRPAPEATGPTSRDLLP